MECLPVLYMIWLGALSVVHLACWLNTKLVVSAKICTQRWLCDFNCGVNQQIVSSIWINHSGHERDTEIDSWVMVEFVKRGLSLWVDKIANQQIEDSRMFIHTQICEHFADLWRNSPLLKIYSRPIQRYAYRSVSLCMYVWGDDMIATLNNDRSSNRTERNQTCM